MELSKSNKVQQKLELIEHHLRMVEGSDAYSLVDASKMSLISNLVLPPKFKVPTFDKYDGTKYPLVYLYMYYQKMTGHTSNDKLLIHCFQNSLIGSATRWYNQLSRENIQSWTDLAKAFWFSTST